MKATLGLYLPKSMTAETIMKNILLTFSVLCILTAAISGQDKATVQKVESPLLSKYENTATQPYGRLNPDAPPETKQFDFMIGTFDCVDNIRNPQNGKWYQSESVWSSSYFLNGFAVQDKYWSPVTVASGTRIFDKKKGKWIVNYFQSQPGYATGVWEGMKEGSNMVMRRKNPKYESRLTFSQITKDGFEWIGETMTKDQTTSGWKISCKRRKN
jgi:hypothetical protein